VQGQWIPVRLRFEVGGLFAIAFIGAALAVFALAHLAGVALHVSELPVTWLLGVAGTVLLALAVADIRAVRNKTYCPISWRRQTPRGLMRQYSPRLVALLWGLDTGLAVTTFRVSAATWGALVLTFLGFGTWWIGIGYGVSFVVPLMAVIWMGPTGKASVAPDPLDPGLNDLLNHRPFAQIGCAVALCVSGVIVLVSAATGLVVAAG
jgi:hypothetical protein